MENQKCTSIGLLGPQHLTLIQLSHKILLDILENHFGIVEQALSWTTLYISSRKFSVQIDQHASKIISQLLITTG